MIDLDFNKLKAGDVLRKDSDNTLWLVMGFQELQEGHLEEARIVQIIDNIVIIDEPDWVDQYNDMKNYSYVGEAKEIKITSINECADKMSQNEES